MRQYNKLTDTDLVHLLKQGDERSFTEIYNRYWAVLYTHARHMLHNRDSARDVVQETFTTIWEKAQEQQLGDNLNAYLYKCVRNRVLNLIRKEKQEHSYINNLGDFHDKGDFCTDSAVNFNELKRLIDKEVENLPAKMRQVFELSRYQHLSHAKISNQLNISDLTVKKQINKAIRILRLKLGIPFSILLFISLFK